MDTAHHLNLALAVDDLACLFGSKGRLPIANSPVEEDAERLHAPVAQPHSVSRVSPFAAARRYPVTGGLRSSLGKRERLSA